MNDCTCYPWLPTTKECLRRMADQEEIDFSDIKQVLHVLRNPYGWNDHIVRNARLIAADAIEQNNRELAALRGFAARVLSPHVQGELFMPEAKRLGLIDATGQPTALLTG